MREISSCSCLTFLPGPAWLLLNKICTPFSRSLYFASAATGSAYQNSETEIRTNTTGLARNPGIWGLETGTSRLLPPSHSFSLSPQSFVADDEWREAKEGGDVPCRASQACHVSQDRRTDGRASERASERLICSFYSFSLICGIKRRRGDLQSE